MASERTEAETTEIHEIIENSTLVAMDFFEVSARRHDVPPDDVGRGS